VDLVRADFALIPGDPLFSAVIAASQAITDEYYYNANIIDDKTFPPHLSLHICAIPRAALGQVSADLRKLAEAGLPGIAATTVEPSYSGYVMLNVARTAAWHCTRQSWTSPHGAGKASPPATPTAAPTSVTRSRRTSRWQKSTAMTRPTPPRSAAERSASQAAPQFGPSTCATSGSAASDGMFSPASPSASSREMAAGILSRR
jgi:hypothetical protein